MELSTIWCNIFISIVAIVLTGIIVMLIRRPLLKQGDFIGVLWLTGIFSFWGTWELTSTLAKRFSYTIIRVDNAKEYSKHLIIGSKSDKFFENQPNCDIEFERTYIDNCSDRNIEIQSIDYGQPQIGFHVNRPNSVDQLILKHTSNECKVVPDYYFEAPNSITIRKKKFSSNSDKVTKRILVYLGDSY